MQPLVVCRTARIHKVSSPVKDESHCYVMQFSTGDLRDNADNIELTYMLECALKPEENGTGNHWMTQLVTADSTAVRIDCYPNHKRQLNDGIIAMIQIREHRRVQTANIAKTVRVPLRSSPVLTLQQVVDTLREHGFDRYKLGLNGKGCRHWILRKVDVLQQLGMVSPQFDQQHLADAIIASWNIDGSKHSDPPPITVGTFL